MDEALHGMLEGGVQKDLRSQDVGLHKGHVVVDGAGDVCFGGQVNDDVSVRDQFLDERTVANIAVHEAEIRIVGAVLGQVVEVTGVRERVKHRQMPGRMASPQGAHEVTPDEPCPPRDQNPHARPR